MVQLYTRKEYGAFLNGRELLEAHECPFCEMEKHKDMIIWEWVYWVVLYNKYPYTGNDQHIMAVPRAHKEFFTEFSPEEIAELWRVHEEVKKFFWEKTYFSFCRETHGTITKSIKHYHMQFIGAELQGKYLMKMLQNQGFPIEHSEKL
jgi:diadenosine tetraphosphate (Ap4A) HIT family hydrolase